MVTLNIWFFGKIMSSILKFLQSTLLTLAILSMYVVKYDTGVKYRPLIT